MTKIERRRDLEEMLDRIIEDGPADTPERIQLSGTVWAIWDDTEKEFNFYTTMYSRKEMAA